jgi:uncharacterized protein YgiM (DUF1202 family)
MLSTRRPRTLARAVLLAAWLVIAGLMAPSATLADGAVAVGGEAIIAYAEGDNVRVREGATYDADIVTSLPEGTGVEVLDGPFSDGDGNAWYSVRVAGITGYIVGDYLASSSDGSVGGNASGSANTGASDTVTASDNVHLRSGPSVGYASIGKIPAGTSVTVAGDGIDGWLRVSWNGFEGWAYGSFFSDGATPATPSAPVDPEPEVVLIEAGTRYARDSVNFRSGPSLGSRVYEQLPAGVAVELTGKSQNGFAEGVANGTTGWVSLDFLTTSAPQEPQPATERIEAGTRYTTDRVNFRTGPSSDSGIIELLDAGVAVELTGKSQDGFAEGVTNGSTGWVSLDFLSMNAPVASEPDPTPEPEPDVSEEPEQPQEAPAAPSSSGSSIVWPMRGGEWYIGQGYNGSSHQNRDGLWQYQYSFDFARTDENTGGEATYSPVSGTVRWLDPATGGISIDAGGGLAVALFHVDIDPSIREGQQLSQGQYLGVVSYPGGGGNGGWAHIHMTAWATSDGGNWDRRAIPFEGATAISGRSFPSSGVSQDWTGTIINP